MSGQSLSGVRIRGGVAALAGAALLLTGCSSGGDDGGDDGIAGIGEGQQTEEPDPGTEGDPEPEDEGVDRPDIQVGPDLEMVFEGEETGDQVKDAVLLDNEWYLKAVYEVITTYDREGSSIGFYAQGDALLRDMDLVESFIADGVTSAGTMRYFNRQVNLVDEDTAEVSYCRDFTKVETVDFETGDVVEEADPQAPATLNTAVTKLSELGVWQTIERTTERGATACQ